MSNVKVESRPALYALTKNGSVGLFVGGMSGKSTDRIQLIPQFLTQFIRK